MPIDDSTPTAPIMLDVSRDEAQLIVAALKMLANSRRFTFREPGHEMDAQCRRLFEAVARIEALVKKNFEDA